MKLITQYLKEDKGYTTPCWIWQGCINSGYGMMRDPSVGKNRYAHVVFYRRKYGPVPVGLQLDHLCKQRDCVNPDHLEPVTRTENNRRGKGTKLNTDTVTEIRLAIANGEKNKPIAYRFGVSKSTIHLIRNGYIWK